MIKNNNINLIFFSLLAASSAVQAKDTALQERIFTFNNPGSSYVVNTLESEYKFSEVNYEFTINNKIDVSSIISQYDILYINAADIENTLANKYVKEAIAQSKKIILENATTLEAGDLSLPVFAPGDIVLFDPKNNKYNVYMIEDLSVIDASGISSQSIDKLGKQRQDNKYVELSSGANPAVASELNDTLNLFSHDVKSNGIAMERTSNNGLEYPCSLEQDNSNLCISGSFNVFTGSKKWNYSTDYWSYFPNELGFQASYSVIWGAYQGQNNQFVAISVGNTVSPLPMEKDTSRTKGWFLEGIKNEVNLSKGSRYPAGNYFAAIKRSPQNAVDTISLSSSSGLSVGGSLAGDISGLSGGLEIGFDESNSFTQELTDWKVVTTDFSSADHHTSQWKYNLNYPRYGSISEWTYGGSFFKDQKLRGVPDTSKYGLQFNNEVIYSGPKSIPVAEIATDNPYQFQISPSLSTCMAAFDMTSNSYLNTKFLWKRECIKKSRKFTIDLSALSGNRSMPAVCGHNPSKKINDTETGGLDNTDKNNAAGNCLKIVKNANNTQWFSSTPSNSVMSALGYIKQDKANNTGHTYAGMSSPSIGPEASSFATFRQDGQGVTTPGNGNDIQTGINGQFDRWCKTLGSLGFAGRSNWRRPTFNELFALDGGQSINMYERFGWPIGRSYGTTMISTMEPDKYINATFDSPYEINKPASFKGYASCVSDN